MSELSKKQLIKHLNELTEEYQHHHKWTSKEYLANEQIRHLIESQAELSEEWAAELCANCQCRYGTAYAVSDELWGKINQGDRFLCPICADTRAQALGIHLFWGPIVTSNTKWFSDEQKHRVVSVIGAVAGVEVEE